MMQPHSLIFSCIVLLSGCSIGNPEAEPIVELRMVLPAAEENSEVLKFEGESLHLAPVPIVTEKDLLLKEPSITEYTIVFNGKPLRMHGVGITCNSLARKRLEGHEIPGNSGLHGAFVIDGRVVAEKLIRWGVLIGGEGFLLNLKTKKECEEVVRLLRDAGVPTYKRAQQGAAPNPGDG